MQKKQKPRDIWLEKGLKILETDGPVALSIDNLARQTQKTKGSFYHHFKSRKEYIDALLTFYEVKTNLEIHTVVEEEIDQRARLKKLTELVFQISSRLELVIRAWALYEPAVKACQDRIDQSRLNHLIQLYSLDGSELSQAKTMAYRNYSIYIGMQQLKHLYDEAKFKKLLKDIF